MTCSIVVMGVAGTGKTTIAKGVAEAFGFAMAEGDEFHSEANKAKMGSGIPLTDEDRWPWLRALRDWMSAEAAEARSSVVACSALKRVYRDILRSADTQVFFVHLVLPEEVNLERLENRPGHFMKSSMLESQLAILEPLEPDEPGVEAVNLGPAGEVVAEVVQLLRIAGVDAKK